MATITAKDCATIFYKEWGRKNAQPIVFHHGWPLSSDDGDNQMLFFPANGYRVIAHAHIMGAILTTVAPALGWS